MEHKIRVIAPDIGGGFGGKVPVYPGYVLATAASVLTGAPVKWIEDRTFIGDSGSGHKIVLGTAFGPEGRSPGPSAMELVLIGLGGLLCLRRRSCP